MEYVVCFFQFAIIVSPLVAVGIWYIFLDPRTRIK